MPLGYIAFPPKGGPVSKVVEELPETKGDIEGTIISRFISTLERTQQRRISHITPHSWPDFVGNEGTTEVGIELVELVNKEERLVRARQEEYLKRILEQVDDIRSSLTGIEIQLDDGHQNHTLWPALRSAEGRALANFVAERLRASLESVQQLSDRIMVRRWKEIPRVGIFAYRYGPPSVQNALRIGFPGGSHGYAGRGRVLLRETIDKKLRKMYAPFAGKLMMLIYEAGSFWALSDGESEMREVAAELLGRGEHPFDEVWYFIPFAREPMGDAQRLWP